VDVLVELYGGLHRAFFDFVSWIHKGHPGDNSFGA
jgi:hypothetical protein